MKRGWLRRFFWGTTESAIGNAGPQALQDELGRRRAEAADVRRQLEKRSQQLAEAEEQGRNAEQAEKQARAENAELRADLEKRTAELARLAGEIEQARHRETQVLAARMDLDRAREAETEKAREQFAAELKRALERNQRLQAETEKLRAQLTRLDSELQHVNSERQRLLSEYGQLCMDAVAFPEARKEAALLKEEVARLRGETEQARAAAPGSGPARGAKKSADQAAELARRDEQLAQRDEEIGRLRDRTSSLEQELASRGSLLPVAGLPPALQQMVAHLGNSADATRMVNELWDRLMEQEARFNAAREDTNRKMAEMDLLRVRMTELYASLVTPITVLSANTDLLVMQGNVPQAVKASLEEMKQTMTAVRQGIARLQKMTQKITPSGT